MNLKKILLPAFVTISIFCTGQTINKTDITVNVKDTSAKVELYLDKQQTQLEREYLIQNYPFYAALSDSIIYEKRETIRKQKQTIKVLSFVIFILTIGIVL